MTKTHAVLIALPLLGGPQLARANVKTQTAHQQGTEKVPQNENLARWGLVTLGIVAALTLKASGSILLAAVLKHDEFSQRMVSDAIRGCAPRGILASNRYEMGAGIRRLATLTLLP
jgi:hypothetical protein